MDEWIVHDEDAVFEGGTYDPGEDVTDDGLEAWESIDASGVYTVTSSAVETAVRTLTVIARNAGGEDSATFTVTVEAAETTLLSYDPGGTITYTGSGSTATYRDASNVWQAGTTNVPRDLHREYSPVAAGMAQTLLLEPQRPQMLPSPGTPSTQAVSLTAGWYVLWLEGTGSVAASGATDGAYGTATANPDNGTVTGTQGTDWLLFNVTVTQDVTFTVTGTVARYNCLQYGTNTARWPTPRSYVPSLTTAIADAGKFTFAAAPQALTVYVRWIHFGFDTLGASLLFRIGSGAASNASFRLLVQATRWLVEHREGASTVDQVLNHSAIAGGFSGSISPTNPDPYAGKVMEVRAVLNANGSCFVGVSMNEATEVVGATSGTLAIGGSWSLGEMLVSSSMAGAFEKVRVLPGVNDLATCRAA